MFNRIDKISVKVLCDLPELLLVHVLRVLVPVPQPDHVALLGVVLHTVGGRQQVAAGDEDSAAPVERPGAASHSD